MVLEKEKISYKHYDLENISKLLTNEKMLFEIGKIFSQEKDVSFKESSSQLKNKFILKARNEVLQSFSKQSHFFCIFKGNNLVGFNKGVVVDKTYFSAFTYVLKKYQKQKIGYKLKLRSVAFLRSRYGVLKFDSTLTLNNLIYKFNEYISKRKQKTKKGTYKLLDHPEKKGDYIYKEKNNKKNLLVFKKKV